MYTFDIRLPGILSSTIFLKYLITLSSNIDEYLSTKTFNSPITLSINSLLRNVSYKLLYDRTDISI